MSPSGTAGVGAYVSRNENKIEKRIAEVRDWFDAEIVGLTINIDRPRTQISAFWRDLQNLARFIGEYSAGRGARPQALAYGMKNKMEVAVGKLMPDPAKPSIAKWPSRGRDSRSTDEGRSFSGSRGATRRTSARAHAPALAYCPGGVRGALLAEPHPPENGQKDPDAVRSTSSQRSPPTRTRCACSAKQ
jgi:hypothetical protein